MGLNTKCPIHYNLHPAFLCPDKEEKKYPCWACKTNCTKVNTIYVHMGENLDRPSMMLSFCRECAWGIKKYIYMLEAYYWQADHECQEISY